MYFKCDKLLTERKLHLFIIICFYCFCFLFVAIRVSIINSCQTEETKFSTYKMDYVDIQAVESKLTDVTVTPIPMGSKISSTGHMNMSNNNYGNHHQQHQQQQQQLHQQQQLQAQHLSTAAAAAAAATAAVPTSALVTPVNNLNHFPNNSNLSKYAQLLMVIEEMGRDIRPTYSGSRSSAERLKRGIVHARILVRECLLETERSARQ
ncbi:uncharacterized protein LOC135702074 [Ochlerotatus camptorhynchus]|uniref:uncharacterized protein LOC135702074 n=1 Tax=Ochlerotatus camptorhynchus TaxID=644619 RepID=UPI0031D28C3B